MFERDYFMRIVEQIRKSLQALAALPRHELDIKAEEELNRCSNALCGLGLDKLLSIPMDSLMSLINLTVPVNERTQLIELLAEIAYRHGYYQHSHKSMERALLLYDVLPEPAEQTTLQQRAQRLSAIFDVLDATT